MTRARTLAVDVGGTGVKAVVLDADGQPASDVARVDTPYPCPPARLAGVARELAAGLPRADRTGLGFPGLIRGGRVVEVNSLMRATPGGPLDDDLVGAWVGCDLAALFTGALAMPVRVANDADVHALATVVGRGLECVLTLGTGLGFSLVDDGVLLPHLELSGAPFLPGRDFEAVLGAGGLAADGRDRWTAHVHAAVAALRPFLYFDRLYLGGGNARLLDPASFDADVVVVDNVNGLLGAHLLWRDAPTP